MWHSRPRLCVVRAMSRRTTVTTGETSLRDKMPVPRPVALPGRLLDRSVYRLRNPLYGNRMIFTP